MEFSTYASVKALHIIFVVSWFAGLFYIVRLFIYHIEAQKKEEVAKKILSDQFEIMEGRLWWIITTPAMILALAFGTTMLVGRPDLLYAPWMQIKLTFVGILLIYHFVCQKIMLDMKKGHFKWKSNGLRLWNELATLVLVSISFLVTLRNEFNWIKGTVGFFAVAIGLMILIKLYKRIRKN
jgi:putative membrane protein